MALELIRLDDTTLPSIAAAIREKTGDTTLMLPSQMAEAIGGITTMDRIEWHQCPDSVRKYLEEVAYDASDYSVSSIDSYAPDVPVADNYRPIGATIGEKTFYNAKPKVETPFAAGSHAGTVKPLDTLRWIRTNTWNVRDLGGWKCDGGTVKYGLLFRGGEVSVNDRDVLVGELGVQHDLNLRGTDEVSWTSSPLGSDVKFTCAKDFNWYSVDANDAWRTNLRTIFDAVTHNQPVYFHCAAGADRTGTIACVIEGILGVSQSDIDKDYELTSFYSGTNTNNNARRRNEAEWTGLISAINAKAGDTFRDKCVTFAAECGFSAADINAFRAAMIDGTPDTVTPAIGAFAVNKTVPDGIVFDNGDTTAMQYQPYATGVTCEDGYVISGITVTMDGTDITAEVWKGQHTNFMRRVKSVLDHCVANNDARKIIDGQSYAATITPEDGYTLAGAVVTIAMGGIDMTQYYANGIIAIPAVNGDVVITVTAVKESDPDNIIVFGDCVAVQDSPTGSAASLAMAEKDTDNGIFITKAIRSTNGTFLWTSSALKSLPAGKYTYSGEFKQDAAGASAIAIFNGSTRILKYSLSAGSTWTAFSYDFEITETGSIAFEAQNDSADSGAAYLRNAKIVEK